MTESAPLTIDAEQFAQWYGRARQQAVQYNVDPYELDWLVTHWTGLDRLSLKLGSFAQAGTINLQRPWLEIEQGWQRRIQERYPVQYLVGQAPWRNFTLQVSPAVLIPRPETELIIDLVQRRYGSDNHGPWVDLGTGSGALALALADLLPQAQIYAVDQSETALAIARENAQSYQLETRISFHQGHWWEPLSFLRGQVQGMVSNPPYIPQAELAQLQPEVINHEPLRALAGGEDGLEAVRELIGRSPLYLRGGGFWLVELMAGQAPTVAAMLGQQGDYEQITIHEDLAGIDRFVSARRKP